LYEPHTHIYQIMPMNVRLNLNEQWRTLNAGVGLQAVDRKNSPAQTRLEPLTPGYMLMNLHTSYSGSRLEAAINVDNLLNRGYALPMGGVNVDDFLASGYSSALRPLTGRGRSVSFTVNAHF
jgi:iron complex outermembrane receptor protein